MSFVVSVTLFMIPKGQGVIRGQRDLLYDPKVNLTFDLDLDLKVKHLTRQVTTNVQATL